ncbi:hypothetical protein GCM10007854_16670 [Algimonas porphyrae]|uniref:DUF3034 family protein n=1 Tax=Algimonas porphyrae TaxID=1128113 RepID=A0ABQ5V0V7_9PROT|nr:hypothetical protein GCM10007854_16670 [Algimonas porphyrae]
MANLRREMLRAIAVAAGLAVTGCAMADLARPDQGRLLATGGVSQVEGTGGAGLASWATITGYGSRDSYGATAFHSRAALDDFDLQVTGAAVGVGNRIELSYARQTFDTGATGPKLGLRDGYKFHQDIVGAKVKVAGDLVFDQNSLMPQISVGAQFKSSANSELVGALGATSRSGVDLYAAASKLVLDRNLLLSASLRGTKANQLGLLGFGGPNNNDYSLQVEGSAVYMVSRHLVLGADYRTKPDNLAFAEEGDAMAAYAAWFPNKSVSFTLAAVDLGPIALQGRQQGVYGSVQLGF